MIFKRKPDRTVKPSGKIIRQLRRALKMSVDDLANKTQCSIKTIENAEASHNLYWFTLHKIASALACPVGKLCPGYEVPVGTDVPNWAHVTIVLDISLTDFDQSAELHSLISSLEKLSVARAGSIKPIDAWEDDKA